MCDEYTLRAGARTREAKTRSLRKNRLSLSDCRKMRYRIGLDFGSYFKARPPAPSGVCNGWRNTEDGREDQEDSISFDRNCLTTIGNNGKYNGD